MAARLFNMDDVRLYFEDNQAELGNELIAELSLVVFEVLPDIVHIEQTCRHL